MPPTDFVEPETPVLQMRRAVIAGLLLTLAQIVFAIGAGAYGAKDISLSGFVTAYRGLAARDSLWYQHIAEHGYGLEAHVQAGKTGNVAFFPAYPVIVRGLHTFSGLPWDLCLLAVSQLAAWGFWTYFLLLLDRHNVPILHARLFALLIMSLPASFFLVAGYSESLLLFSMLGFILWTDSDTPSVRWIGAAHGIVMTATQFLGLAAVIYPIISSLLRAGPENWFEKLIDGILMAAVACLGGFGFFGFCQYHFGAWDVALLTLERDWNMQPNYLALFRGDTYLLDIELWQTNGFLSPDWLSRALVPLFVLGFAIVLGMEIYLSTTQPSSTAYQRVAYYVTALCIFVAAAVAFYGNQYRSMIRALLPVTTLLAVYLADLLSNEDVESGDAFTVGLALLIIVPAFLVQSVFLQQFLNGIWLV
jgi:hypothetical protein